MSLGVYILRCADNSYYTGHTDNLDKRIVEHQTGEIECYTSTRLPLTLVFADEFPTRDEALARERQIKGWSRRKKEAMIRGDWSEVRRLSRKRVLRQAQDERKGDHNQ
jgi:predicted GIY-YIG superfamily endonuclease